MQALQQLYWSLEGVSELVVCIVLGLMLLHREVSLYVELLVCRRLGLNVSQV